MFLGFAEELGRGLVLPVSRMVHQSPQKVTHISGQREERETRLTASTRNDIRQIIFQIHSFLNAREIFYQKIFKLKRVHERTDVSLEISHANSQARHRFRI